MKTLSLARKTIKKFNMLSPGETVVVGVSGGADSVGLLYVLAELKEYNLKLVVSHLDHGIRRKGGKRDAKFVKGIATRLGLPFELQNVSTPAFKKESNLSLEEAARVLRYRFLKEALHKHGAHKIATGHTLDDQAETVLMRLIRGSGALGLSGIPPVSGGFIIRPLIETPKSEVRKYLGAKGIDWVEDLTNRSKVYLRNRIRHDLVPELEKYNPRIKETLARTGSLLRAQEEFIKSIAVSRAKYLFRPLDGKFIGTVSDFKSFSEVIRFALLRMAIEELKGDLRKISFKHIASVDDFLSSQAPSGEIALPDEIVVVKGYGLFWVARKSELEWEFSYTVPGFGNWNFPRAEFEIELAKVEALDKGDKFTALFDPDSVKFPIEVRNLRRGDRFVPLGMKRHKKVKRFFIDEKVPRFLRNRIPIFLTRGEIMWVGGMRIDERFKARGKNAVKIRLIKPKR